MVRIRILALAGLIAAGVLPAQAGVTVIGGGLAQACFQSVKVGRADRALLDLCTRSLEEEALGRRDRAGTYVNRGIVELRLRELDEALSDFDRAERLNPAIGEIYVNRGVALIGKAEYARAVEQIDRGLGLGPVEPHKAYFNRAVAKEGLDDLKGAYLDYRRAAELRPEWPLPQTQLARFTVTTR